MSDRPRDPGAPVEESADDAVSEVDTPETAPVPPFDEGAATTAVATAAVDAVGLEEADLDGHTVDELVDYLDAGREPADPSIEGSAACRIALDALERVRSVAERILDEDARAEAPRDDSWLLAIMANISREARAGRRVPLSETELDDELPELAVTEGALRGVVRAAGDADPDVITGRCRFEGDLERFGAVVDVRMTVTVRWGRRALDAAEEVRERVRSALAEHSDLVLGSIDIVVDDLWHSPAIRELTDSTTRESAG